MITHALRVMLGFCVGTSGDNPLFAAGLGICILLFFGSSATPHLGFSLFCEVLVRSKLVRSVGKEDLCNGFIIFCGNDFGWRYGLALGLYSSGLLRGFLKSLPSIVFLGKLLHFSWLLFRGCMLFWCCKLFWG